MHPAGPALFRQFTVPGRVGLLLGCVLGLTVPARCAEATGRPNVVVIITDDQRWDCLGCAVVSPCCRLGSFPA